jgi:hypothetical protein
MPNVSAQGTDKLVELLAQLLSVVLGACARADPEYIKNKEHLKSQIAGDLSRAIGPVYLLSVTRCPSSCAGVTPEARGRSPEHVRIKEPLSHQISAKRPPSFGPACSCKAPSFGPENRSRSARPTYESIFIPRSRFITNVQQTPLNLFYQIAARRAHFLLPARSCKAPTLGLGKRWRSTQLTPGSTFTPRSSWRRGRRTMSCGTHPSSRWCTTAKCTDS